MNTFEPFGASYVQVDPTTVSLLTCDGCGALVRALHMSRHTKWHDTLAALGDPTEQPASGENKQWQDNQRLRRQLVDYQAGADWTLLSELPHGDPLTPGWMWGRLLNMSRGERLGTLAAWLDAARLNDDLRAERAADHARYAGLSQGETNRLRQVEEVLLELGGPRPHATTTPNAGPMIAWLREKLGRYTWRPGDPPPPAYIRVLHDIDEEDSPLRYLCRVGSSNDWQWLDHPDHAYSGPALTWELVVAIEPDSDHVLVQVPGGDV